MTKLTKILQYAHEHQIKINPDHRYIGIFFCLFAWLIVALLALFFYSYEKTNPSDQVNRSVFVPIFFIFLGLFFSYFVFMIKNPRKFKIQSPWLVFGRGLLGVISFLLYMIAKTWPSCVDNSLIFSTEALFVPLLQRVIGIKLLKLSWLGILIGMLGVGVFYSFSMNLLSGGFWVAAGSAFVLSIVILITGYVIQKDSPLCVAFYQSLIGLLITGPLAIIFWDSPSWREMTVMFVSGIFYSWAFFLFLDAYFYLEAWIIAILNFALVVFVELIKWALQENIPTSRTLTACCLIFAGTLIVIFSSYRKKHLSEKTTEKIIS